jgi:LL-diaminopimelate aminotransferase
MKKYAQRMDHLPTFFFASRGVRIAEKLVAGEDVIRLDVGSPDLPPSVEIIDALTKSAYTSEHHGYQPHRGIKELRVAWSRLYEREFQVKLDPEIEIVPLLGSKEGIFNLIQAVVEPGDVVLVPDPSYVTYTRGTLFAGGEPYFMPLLPDNGYLPDFSKIPADFLRRAKILWLNYPNNPTAAFATFNLFEEAIAFGQEHNLLVCNDAAYAQVTFNGKNAPSILQVPGAKEISVEFNTLSKSHNMAGWRTAVVVGNPQMVNVLYTLKTNIDSGHFLPIMEASVVALTGDQEWIRERNEIYRKRRDIVIHGLGHLGMKSLIPEGTLYVWSTVPEGWSSIDFVDEALESANVSLAPGDIFGDRGRGYIRISLTTSFDRMIIAMERLKEWLQI